MHWLVSFLWKGNYFFSLLLLPPATEGYLKVMFSVCQSGGGGGGVVPHGLWSQVPSLVSGPRSFWGIPSVLSGFGGGRSLSWGYLSWPGQWGNPPPDRTAGTPTGRTGVPPPPHCREPGRLCGAGGMPLAFTQDFLVFINILGL